MSIKFNPFTGNLDLVGGSDTTWSKLSNTIPSSSVSVVDSISNNDFESLKYIVTIFNKANSAYRSFEFSILNNNGSYKDVLSHKIKSGASVSVDTNNNAGTLELKITNNESFDLQVELAKLILF